LIFIAGIHRNNFGQLGLHRPYLTADPKDRHTVETQMPRMFSAVQQYVAEMGSPAISFNKSSIPSHLK
jgi:hypothetical protein